ncbi:retrovirus-related pol polyprotein from transposon TNT 1-94 [Tanacetum coccineum]
MDFRSTPCVFLGYSPSHHGYRCLDISTERLYIARHVRFNEAQFPFDIPKTTSPPPSKTSPYYSSESPYVIPTTDHPSPSSPRSPISSPSSVSHLSPTSQTSPESSNGQPSPVSTTSIPTPPPPTPPPPPPITRQCPTNLCQNPKQRVPYNPSANHATVLPTTITEPTSFTVANNSPEWRQAMKEEYDALMKNGTWSLVPRASNTNVVDDIQNAFLHGNLKEQVYMKQPPGFIDPQRPNHVCLLHKSLYSLKQAPRAWFERLSKALFDLGFKGSKTDPSLFIYSRGDTLLYILVYVDDIIVTGNNKGTIDNIICHLGSTFALKDLGSLNYFLGIEIVPHVSGILLSQKKYILELLQSVVSNCNPVLRLRIIGLQLNGFYVIFMTVEHGMLIRRSSGSTLQAFTDVIWKGNPDTSLEAFSDADWAGDSDD